MKRLSLVIFSLLFGQAYAQDDTAEKTEVLQLVKKYSETVACETTFEREQNLSALLKDVYPMERDEEYGSATYYVLWGGDMGCAGGSGTWFHVMTKVDRGGSGKPFTVSGDNALGDDYGKVNPRFIESVEKVSLTEFKIVSADFADDDSLNFPSKSYQYTLKRPDEWKAWTLTDSKYLGKKE